MPITTTDKIKTLDQEQFHVVDKSVMGIAFDLHNTIGRLFNEKVYQSALFQRLSNEGHTCMREVEITLSHKGFNKSYFADLIVDGVIYETKVAATLTRRHEAQLLNYMLLSDVNHAKLLNFKTPSVEFKFISTRLNRDKRRIFEIRATDTTIGDALENLLSDWGTHLALDLYREALTQLLGSQEDQIQIRDAGIEIGNQRIPTLSDHAALIITSITQVSGIENYRKHLLRLLRNTNLSGLHWINFNQNDITQVTLDK